MKLYLSSYKIGDKREFLSRFASEVGAKTYYIPNALDFTSADPVRRADHIKSDVEDLVALGFQVEVLDLKEYFNKQTELKRKLSEVNSVWVSGGNTFVLRQAMKLSGFDDLMHSYLSSREDFLYSGYSAGICVLSPDLSHLQIVDDATDIPYSELSEVEMNGLDYIDFAILPHYDSDHPESKAIDEEIKYCIENKILFIALRDGEVILLE